MDRLHGSQNSDRFDSKLDPCSDSNLIVGDDYVMLQDLPPMYLAISFHLQARRIPPQDLRPGKNPHLQ